MKTILRLLVTLSIISGACTKNDSITLNGPSTLIGKWNWIYSCGGFYGNMYTPQSTGQKTVIEFDSDFYYRVFINDILKSEAKYSLEKLPSIYGSDSAMMIIRELNPIRQSYTIRNNDTLYLLDECHDCYEHLYERIK